MPCVHCHASDMLTCAIDMCSVYIWRCSGSGRNRSISNRSSGGGDADMCTRNSVSGSGRNRSISRCDSGRNNSR